MEEYKMIFLLYRLETQCNRNGLFVAKKIIKQELENLKGITEQKCKKIKVRKDYCIYCKNYNCSLNKNNERFSNSVE